MREEGSGMAETEMPPMESSLLPLNIVGEELRINRTSSTLPKSGSRTGTVGLGKGGLRVISVLFPATASLTIC